MEGARRVQDEPEHQCHELLLRLAGRIPDAQLWRFRDWLAGGAIHVLARALPRLLLRERIGVTRDEQRLLWSALLPAGADPSAIGAVLGADEAPASGYTFNVNSPDQGASPGDSALVVLGATLRDRQGVGEVRFTWRHGGGAAPKRLLLIIALTELSRLAGEVQRTLRALGEHEPGVEVFSPDADLPAYHREAKAASELVCVGPADLFDLATSG
jgi:hypothetical protein